ncbi:MAG TPA: hypothetical protein VNU21_22470 [Usitatibacter sp.]|nr:hypothetical protein [Usitatibacter sp.]
MLLDFNDGRASKSEAMRALGITTVYELRAKWPSTALHRGTCHKRRWTGWSHLSTHSFASNQAERRPREATSVARNALRQLKHLICREGEYRGVSTSLAQLKRRSKAPFI